MGYTSDNLGYIGNLRSRHSVSGNLLGYEIDVRHDGLHKMRTIKGRDRSVVEINATVQIAQWDEQYATIRAAAAKTAEREQRQRQSQSSKERKRAHQDEQKQIAETRAAEAQSALANLSHVLSTSLEKSAAIDWAAMKAPDQFPTPPPERPSNPPSPTPGPLPPEPAARKVPTPPNVQDSEFQPKMNMLDRIFSARRNEKENGASARFNNAYKKWELDRDSTAKLDAADRAAWEREKLKIAARDAANLAEYHRELLSIDQDHACQIESWKAKREGFSEEIARQHRSIEAFQAKYEASDPGTISEYCEMVLANSRYPDCCPREFDVLFHSETGILIVDYKLPSPASLPTLTDVKYVAASDSFTEKYLAESKKAELYDSLVYQNTLRTVHELFSADKVNALKSIVFNGHVTALDRGTGSEVTGCIVSLHAAREAFLSINLAKVDPKSCFRQLKGVGSSKLHSIAPVAPIMTINREDKRFIPSHEVADHLNEGTNLAAMDWEEFEHLIREIFGRELATSGGEVKVTQASRDGGVDAVAFDPDPIRGGKIVIQAKRYTNTVGVSAVRDLYGTILNEGATKGILVTTSHYGPDAYEFAQGKPITLLDGGNLLSLLARHGVKGRIDLIEAKLAADAQSRLEKA